MARGDEEPGSAKRHAGPGAPPVPLAINPFYAGWAVAAATGRLIPKGSVRWTGGSGARVPTRRALLLGRMPLPHLAALRHDHCFSGEPDLGDDPREGLSAIIAAADRSLISLKLVPADSAAHDVLARRAGAVITQTRRRAMLRATGDLDGYLASALRGKKRKELRRLRARLEEQGAVEERLFGPRDDLERWTEDFLALEASGWKGEAGTAMTARREERAYLELLLDGARDAGALRFFRLALDGRPLAMVVGLQGADGGLYTYKIAHDPAFARFSPGVMIMLAVTRHVLDSGEAAYADSCAKEGHAMIEQIWAERRVMHDWLIPAGAFGRTVTAVLAAAGRATRP